MDVNKLKCIFANQSAEYSIKSAAGVACGKHIANVALAFNYWQIADAHANHNCDITPDTLNKIVAYQDTQYLTIQTCC